MRSLASPAARRNLGNCTAASVVSRVRTASFTECFQKACSSPERLCLPPDLFSSTMASAFLSVTAAREPRASGGAIYHTLSVVPQKLAYDAVDNPSTYPASPRPPGLPRLPRHCSLHRLYRVMAGYSISDGTQFEGSPFPKSLNTRVINSHMFTWLCSQCLHITVRGVAAAGPSLRFAVRVAAAADCHKF